MKISYMGTGNPILLSKRGKVNVDRRKSVGVKVYSNIPFNPIDAICVGVIAERITRQDSAKNKDEVLE